VLTRSRQCGANSETKGSLTDLLIGDLFKDSLDEVFVLIDGMKEAAAAAADE